MLKDEIRQIYRSQRNSLSAFERNEQSRRITNQFFSHFRLNEVQNLHLFLSIKANLEIETRGLYEKLWCDFLNLRTFVPRVRGLELEHLEFNQETKLSENKWKIPEPTGQATVDEKLFDVVLIPLLCFDKAGFRVGYGKGFYDKFLSRCRTECLKIGLSFFPAVPEITDKNEFDVKLDYCLTPNKVWKF